MSCSCRADAAADEELRAKMDQESTSDKSVESLRLVLCEWTHFFTMRSLILHRSGQLLAFLLFFDFCFFDFLLEGFAFFCFPHTRSKTQRGMGRKTLKLGRPRSEDVLTTLMWRCRWRLTRAHCNFSIWWRRVLRNAPNIDCFLRTGRTGRK